MSKHSPLKRNGSSFVSNKGSALLVKHHLWSAIIVCLFTQLLPLKVQLSWDLQKCFPAELLNRSQTRVGTRYGLNIQESNLKNERVSVPSGFNILAIYCGLFESLRKTCYKQKSPNAFLLYVRFHFCTIMMMHNVLNLNSNVNKMLELSSLSIKYCMCTQDPVPCGPPV